MPHGEACQNPPAALGSPGLYFSAFAMPMPLIALWDLDPEKPSTLIPLS